MSQTRKEPIGSRALRRIRQRLRRRAALREAAYLAGLLVTAAAAYVLLILLPGKLKTRELETRQQALTLEVRGLSESIERNKRETAGLESDPWAVERAVRARMGYLRTGERVFENRS